MPLAALTFLMVVSFVPGAFGAIDPRWEVFGIGAALILVFTKRGVVGPAHWFGGALLLWISLGLFWTVSTWETLGGLLRFSVMGAGFLVAHEQTDLTRFWRALACAACMSAMVSIFQVLGGVPLLEGIPSGFFAGKSPAAEIMVLGAIAICALARAENEKSLLLLLTAPICAVVALQAREAAFVVLALLPAVAPMIVARRFGVRTAPAIMLLAFLVVPPLIVMAQTGHLGRHDDRLAIWKLIAANTSLVGDGLGALSIAAPAWEGGYNEFLQFAFELGVGSALIWGMAVYALGANESFYERTGLAAVLAMCCVSSPLHHPATAFVACILAGYLCGVRDRARAGRARGRSADLARVDLEELIGIGALHESDLARVNVPADAQSALGPRTIRAALPDRPGA